MSNQCLQMTTSISCANRCTFCWRDYKAPVSKDWKWEVDDPKFIIKGSILAHHKLLDGFKGNPKSIEKIYFGSRTVRHVALSLTGEPITYPKLNELIQRFNDEGISTFLVTNAQYPEKIRDLTPVTQLYLSIDAPNKELLKKVDLPLFKDYWERMLRSLRELSKKSQRTAIRLTIIKGINDVEPQNYAELIKMGNPDFIEVKGYMHVGASRQRLLIKNMPWHEEVVDFAKKILSYLQGYEIVSEHVPSRVVMLAKKKFFVDGEWFTWIDFEKYSELVNSGKPFTSMDYIKKTPRVGLSGRMTRLEAEQKLDGKYVDHRVDEKTDEMEFWMGKQEDC